MRIADSVPSAASFEWVVRERRGGVWVEIFRKRNIITNTGLSYLASAFAGGQTAPQWLALESKYASMPSGCSLGVNSVLTNGQVHQGGDTQIILSPGLGNVETRGFSTCTDNLDGTFTYALTSNTTHTHSAGEVVVRPPLQSDTIANLANEVAPDPIGSPTLRTQLVSGYSPATGQYTYQFYLTGTEANVLISHIGLVDDDTLGLGNLHTHLAYGIDHTFVGPATAANDLQIEGTLTVINN